MTRTRELVPVTSTRAPTGPVERAASPEGPHSDAEVQKLRFGPVATALALAQIFTGGTHTVGAAAHLGDIAAQLKARDPVEEMLIQQMVLTHARVVRLSAQSLNEQNESWRELLSGEYERAANLFRRQMLAFHEYRQPTRGTFVAVRHANIAAQQVVQQQMGSAGGHDGVNQKALPPLAQRPFVAAHRGAAKSAVGEIDRAPHSRGKGEKLPERATARPSIRNRNR